MENTYTEYWHRGRKDREDSKVMSLPSTIPDAHMYRGYMDGWSGRECVMPVSAVIKYKPRVTIN
jgi:hypothetical protein